MDLFMDFQSVVGLPAPTNIEWNDGQNVTSWGLGDVADVTVEIPGLVVMGTDLTLSLDTASKEVSRGLGIEVTSSVGSASHTEEWQFTSSPTAESWSQRSLLVISGGRIGDHVVSAGDVVRFRVRRIAASLDEDSGSVAITDVRVRLLADPIAATETFTGRLAVIVREVRALTRNYCAASLADEEILVHVNRVVSELSSMGMFSATADLAVQAGSTTVDLTGVFPKVDRVASVVGITNSLQVWLFREAPSYSLDIAAALFQGLSSPCAVLVKDINWRFDRSGMKLHLEPALPAAVTVRLRYLYAGMYLSADNTDPQTAPMFDGFYVHKAAGSVVTAYGSASTGGRAALLEDGAARLLPRMWAESHRASREPLFIKGGR